MSPPSRVLVSRLALALVCLVFTSVKADVVVQLSGKRVEGVSVLSAKWDQVLFKQGKNTIKLDGDKVVSIQRDSAYLQPARSSLAGGNYKKALSILEKLDGRGLKGWQAAELQYLKGKIHLESGNPDKADEAFKQFVSANIVTKDYWLPHAIYGRGQANLDLGRGNAAQQHFKGLASYGPTWQLRAKLGEAHGLYLAKKYVEARTKFQEVVNDRKAPAALKVDALIGRIEVIVSQEQFDKAIADLEKNFFSATAQTVNYRKARARATYLMGVSYKNISGKENLEKAEIWLLKAVVLYRQHKGIYKKSCSKLAEVYKQLGRSDRAAEWGKRAEG